MKQVLCAGAACIDRKYRLQAPARAGTSNPARIERTFGGVARNVAENLSRLGTETTLFAAVGDDTEGAALLEHARSAGIDTGLSVRDARFPTPEYGAVLTMDGELSIGLAETSAIEALTASDFEKRWNAISAHRWLFLDCNLQADAIAWCVRRARCQHLRVAVDAVSEEKARRLPEDLAGIDLLVLNESEAAAACVCGDPSELRERGAAAVIVTRGATGAVALTAQTRSEVPAVRASCIDATGGGDALVAGTLWRLLAGDGLIEAVRAGSLCAALTIESTQTVRPDLCAQLLRANRHRLEACTAS